MRDKKFFTVLLQIFSSISQPKTVEIEQSDHGFTEKL